MIAALALGSNLRSRWGEPAATLHEAVHRLGDLGVVAAISSFYQTEPVGFLDQPAFLNAAALLKTQLDPSTLMRALLALEASMGRVRSATLPSKGPRILDLDLLLYGPEGGQNLVLNTPELILPHPAMHGRRFVLEPLAEIAPELEHPVLGQRVRELLSALEVARPTSPRSLP